MKNKILFLMVLLLSIFIKIDISYAYDVKEFPPSFTSAAPSSLVYDGDLNITKKYIYQYQIQPAPKLYCLKHDLTAPNKKTCNLVKTDSEAKLAGLAAIIDSVSDDSDWEYYWASVAVYKYMEGETVSGKTGQFKQYLELAEEAEAKVLGFGIKASVDSTTLKLSGDYYVSDVIKVSVSYGDGYSVKLSARAAEVINKTDNSFQIRIPAKEVEGEFKVTTTVITTQKFKIAARYNCGDRYQEVTPDLLVPVEREKSVKLTFTGKKTPPKPVCEWTTETACCDEKDKLSGAELEQFKKEHPACFKTPPKPTDCKYPVESNKISCSSTPGSGSIKDTSDWNCIYKSTLDSQYSEYDVIKDNFFKWENDYCAVYCREEINYNYPGNSMTVLAGTHFILGRNQVTNGPSNFSLPRLSPISFSSTTECRVTKEKNSTEATINYDKFKQDYEKANNNVKIAWNNWQNSKTNVNKSIYNQAVKTRDNILNDINACNNFIMKNTVFEPVINFEYEEPVYGKEIKDLASGLSITIQTTDNANNKIFSSSINNGNVFEDNSKYTALGNDFVVTVGNNGKKSKVNYWNCNNTTCTKIEKEYSSNASVIQKTTKEYNYVLPTGIYQYVNKTTGKSYNSASSAGGSGKYVYIPYSNLPIDYYTPTGKYDYELNVATLGKVGNTSHKFNRYIQNYTCTYNVKNEITPPEDGGIDLIFRTISLDNPFPSINADGREPGANWNATENGKKVSVETYITNNRGVKTEEIYKNLDPLYKITLTPSLIKQIRAYNDKQDRSYADFTLTCDSNGRNCKSNFIRNTVSGYNFIGYFSGCGIKNKATGLKCSTKDAW